MMNESILVTGATGYIGSHTCVCLLKAGWRVIAMDNLCNSSPRVVLRIQEICGRPMPFHPLDVRDHVAVSRLIQQENISAVIHFAGLKAVGESVTRPLDYFDNNVAGSITLLRALHQQGVRKLVFSSSATVYGDPSQVPVTETAPLSAANPYGRTKLMVEQILDDMSDSDPEWRIATLRYFNPAGAHESGLLGEAPRGVPNNLMPFVAQVAVGRLPCVQVHGDDYPTPDGTGIRDYIHVMDLARGHLAALERLFSNPGRFTVNLGTGQGVSVLEAVAAFERACGKSLPLRVGPRRPGDIAACYASAQRARELLGWKAERSFEQMCADHWRWQCQNPAGY
ncbi:MAG: UDP-glucose 4-epimerase GalE [Pseudomonadota bacterium]|jgi:UDP-glucose 4-epimerase